MSSFREKIQKFEQLGKDTTEKKSDLSASSNMPRDGKKFFYPGKPSPQMSNDSMMVLPQAKVKQNTFQDYDADLQEVWSVRKNIHHGSRNDTNSNYGTPRYYSRHGAIPAQPPGDTQARFLVGRSWRKRSPLQEQNESSTKTWNLKTPGFSYTECAKRPGQSPTEGDSPPQTKRKFTIREGSPKLAMDVPPIRNFFFQSQEKNDKKSQYAQRMVQGHLKSIGMGKYATDAGYTKHQKDNKTVWKKPDQDEFSF